MPASVPPERLSVRQYKSAGTYGANFKLNLIFVNITQKCHSSAMATTVGADGSLQKHAPNDAEASR